MVAQIFCNLEGKPEVANTADFTDVSGHWAENAISWIQQSGVVAGYGTILFVLVAIPPERKRLPSSWGWHKL